MFNRKNEDQVDRSLPQTHSTAMVPPRAAPRAEIPRRPADSGLARQSAEPANGVRESKKLIVGPNISLQGHIASCDRLVVEGTVTAELTDCHTIEITENGYFTGAAEIEGAEISGRYEGSLTVRDRLLIHGTGSVTGNVRYGRLEVEPGGIINGDIKSIRGEQPEPIHEEMPANPVMTPSPILAEAAAGSR